MPKLIFSSDDLPRHLSNAARVSAWRDQFAEKFGPAADPIAQADVPFHGSIEVVPLSGVTLGAFRGSFANVDRTKAGITADGSDHMNFVINLSPTPYHIVQNGREAVVGAGGASIFSEASACIFGARDGLHTLAVRLERPALPGLVAAPGGRAAGLIPADSESLQLLKSYAVMLMAAGGVGDPAISKSVSNHLVDLVTLALGPTSRDAAHDAQKGGLRAARLAAVLAAIEAGF